MGIQHLDVIIQMIKYFDSQTTCSSASFSKIILAQVEKKKKKNRDIEECVAYPVKIILLRTILSGSTLLKVPTAAIAGQVSSPWLFKAIRGS